MNIQELLASDVLENKLCDKLTVLLSGHFVQVNLNVDGYAHLEITVCVGWDGKDHEDINYDDVEEVTFTLTEVEQLSAHGLRLVNGRFEGNTVTSELEYTEEENMINELKACLTHMIFDGVTGTVLNRLTGDGSEEIWAMATTIAKACTLEHAAKPTRKEVHANRRKHANSCFVTGPIPYACSFRLKGKQQPLNYIVITAMTEMIKTIEANPEATSALLDIAIRFIATYATPNTNHAKQ
ncbi:hypothetical protein [Candidatus Colwellia aromaticivorans]|uniref:hypothetical protein n=1 Tax=Candidatus Colwellia aromaticivorans TaxID=2267621 RepID=UPI000DF1FD6C|nr:hypothetical protein [Candidatus Colwellia aromaticivorans]